MSQAPDNLTDVTTLDLLRAEMERRRRKKQEVARPVFFGAARWLQETEEPECLLAGPAGTGKSLAALTKLHQAMLDYPGARALIVRKTRESLSESGLVTYEQYVLGVDNPIVGGRQRNIRQSYKYPNGSVVNVGGIDKASKIMSTEYDMIYCFVGETRVESPSRIEGAYVRSYSGPLVTIRTAAGHELTGSPNHPIFTDHGWVALGLLQEGDNVVSRRLVEDEPARGNPDVAHQPPMIAEVARTLALAPTGRTERMKTVAMDFHGDGGDGDVDIVWTEGRLQRAVNPARVQPVAQRDGLRRDLQAALGMRLRAARQVLVRMGRVYLAPFRVFSQLTHAYAVGVGGNPALARARAGGLEVPRPVGMGVPDVPVGLRLAHGALPEPAPPQLGLEGRVGDPDGSGEFDQAAFASLVALDRVVHVRRWDQAPGTSRHVYNLQTSHHYYFANNIVAHNCQEATELTETDWESLSTRLRNGRMPYQQLLGDCNPDAPTHWLRRRADSGKCKMVDSRHEDNPRLWDRVKQEWTAFGRAYIEKLDRLTGVRYQRLRLGLWVGAEGAVYEEWDRSKHVIPWSALPGGQIPYGWRRVRVVDFGYTNPFVCYDDQTDILTRVGWMRFDDLPRGVEVATVNPDTKALEWQMPTAYIKQRYQGSMVTSEPTGESANFSVTPNHQMIVGSDRTGVWRMERADALASLGSGHLPTGWRPVEHNDAAEPFHLMYKNARGRALRVETTVGAFARFLGFWLAEGCLYEQHVKSIGEVRRFVRIAQKRDPEVVRGILAAINVTWSEHKDTNGVIDFRVRNMALYSFLECHCGKVYSREKRIPAWAWQLGADSLSALLDGLILGDGAHRTHDATGRRICSDTFITTSPQLADGVQMLACLLGRASTLSSANQMSGYGGRDYPVYTVRLPVSKRARVRKLPLRETAYDGYVHCVTVPNGTVVVRRGGRPMVAGNCLWGALDGDGRLYIYRQIYMTQRTVKDHTLQMVTLSAGEEIEATIADHDAEDRATMLQEGIGTLAADKRIRPGIDAVKARLRLAPDGRPRLYILEDTLVAQDPNLLENLLPTSLVQEFDGYVWAMGNEALNAKEVPIKKNDHALDALRYLVLYLDGPPATVEAMPPELQETLLNFSGI